MNSTDRLIAALAIAEAIVARVPFLLMDRLVILGRWNVTIEQTKLLVVAKLGAAFDEDAWQAGKLEAWLAYAVTHNFEGWPTRQRLCGLNEQPVT